MLEISATELLKLLAHSPQKIRCVDVRSENEFAQGAIPSFKNIPILANEERHLVGLCYKTQGQSEAIALGHKLVEPHKFDLVRKWCSHLEDTDFSFVTCWRGGLRSQIATEWITSGGSKCTRVAGGYKALRNELIPQFNSRPPLIVLAGHTGCGKTRLLRQLEGGAVDLEAMAHHRGSAFGRDYLLSQPSQATFENTLALQMLRLKGKTLILENESRRIGSLSIPAPLLEKMNAAEIIQIEMSVEERTSNILEDYIVAPLASGLTSESLREFYAGSLEKIKSKLGGLKESEIRKTMHDAFSQADMDLHREWIKELLVHYYDKAYEHSLARGSQKTIFKGDWSSCLNWIQNRYA